MKHLGIALLALLAAVIPSYGALFTDPVGVGDTSYASYDIKSVEITHTDSQLTFRIDLNAKAANYMRYLISIDSKNGGYGGGAGSWETSIRTTQQNDYFLAGCLDGQLQGTLWSWNNDAWSQSDISANVARGTSYFTFTLNRQDLGLINGSAIKFDVFTSDGAMNSVPRDALSNTAPIGDGGYTSSTFLTYEVSSVPEPAHYGLICAAGLIGVATFQNWRNRKTIPSKH